MSRPGHAYSDPVAQPAPPVPAAADQGGISPRFPLALAGVAIFASIRLLALGVSAFLLPRGKFQTLHYSLWHLIASWDSGRPRKSHWLDPYAPARPSALARSRPRVNWTP